MRKLAFTAVLALLIGGGLMIGLQGRAAAQWKTSPCNPIFSACGYYSGTQQNADCNVLPGSNAANWCTAADTSTLFGDTSTAAFTGDVNAALFSGSGGGYGTNQHLGASLIVNSMLGFVDMYNGNNTNKGWVDAKNAYNGPNGWLAKVNAIGAPGHTCNVAGQATCPGMTYGINFGYQPSMSVFCTTGHRYESGYDPVANDPVIYPVFKDNATDTTSLDYQICNLAHSKSLPEIVFFWPGGEFHIGSKCGNIQGPLSPLPALDTLPTASLSLTCDHSTGHQYATINFNDPDGATTATFVVGTLSTSYAAPPGSPVDITAFVTSYPPQQQGTLTVDDSGPLAPPAAQTTVTDQTDVPCVVTTCGTLSYSPDPLDPHMTGVSITTPVTVTGTPPTPTISVTGTPPVGAAYSFSRPAQAATVSGGVATTTFTALGPFNNTGVWGVSWTLYSAGIPVVTCTGNIYVVDLPYLNVWGGDVMVGATPAFNTVSNTSQCLQNGGQNAGIFSWNNLGLTYSGGGTQYAVQALGQIESFATGLHSTNGAPTGLSFANDWPADPNKLNTATGEFGGFFNFAYSGTGGDCDFTSDVAAQKVSNAVANAEIAGLPISGLSGSTIIYTTGNVYIPHNLAYSTSGWIDNTKIPYFKLVTTGGNIYIDNSVSQLDGIFVAEPLTSGFGGSIYTCSAGNGVSIDPTSAGTSNYFNTCNVKLLINGVFIAKQVQFGRTSRLTVSQASGDTSPLVNDSAEVFNYTPEVWLPRGTNPPPDSYTAITGLPPIL